MEVDTTPPLAPVPPAGQAVQGVSGGQKLWTDEEHLRALQGKGKEVEREKAAAQLAVDRATKAEADLAAARAEKDAEAKRATDAEAKLAEAGTREKARLERLKAEQDVRLASWPAELRNVTMEALDADTRQAWINSVEAARASTAQQRQAAAVFSGAPRPSGDPGPERTPLEIANDKMAAHQAGKKAVR